MLAHGPTMSIHPLWSCTYAVKHAIRMTNFHIYKHAIRRINSPGSMYCRRVDVDNYPFESIHTIMHVCTLCIYRTHTCNLTHTDTHTCRYTYMYMHSTIHGCKVIHDNSSMHITHSITHALHELPGIGVIERL
jgi:hypothetical protein